MSLKRLFIISALSVLTLTGCKMNADDVPKAKYDSLEAEYNALVSEHNSLVADYNSIIYERDSLRKKLDEAENTYASLQAQIDEKASADARQEEASVESSVVNSPFEVGDTFEVSGLRITVDEIDLEYYTYSDRDIDVARRGKKYIGAAFSVKNVSSKKEDVGMFLFKCYADNQLCDYADFKTGELGWISPDRETSFGLFWEVPEDASDIEIEVDGSKDYIIKVK